MYLGLASGIFGLGESEGMGAGMILEGLRGGHPAGLGLVILEVGRVGLRKPLYTPVRIQYYYFNGQYHEPR